MTFNVREHRIVVHLNISPHFIRRHKTYGVLGHVFTYLINTDGVLQRDLICVSDHKDDQLYENNSDLLTLSISDLYLIKESSLKFSYVIRKLQFILNCYLIKIYITFLYLYILIFSF